jgi:hypothetical protein
MGSYVISILLIGYGLYLLAIGISNYFYGKSMRNFLVSLLAAVNKLLAKNENIHFANVKPDYKIIGYYSIFGGLIAILVGIYGLFR